MSAYGHQMEREYSARSLSNRENSGTEMGSRYVMESGFYMTSFAATIFIAGLVTVGVLLITLLIALTVMLQSCQSKSSGVVEIQKASDDCKIFALYAELNSLEADEFPSICRAFASQHIRVGQYARDLNATMLVVENYFSSIMPLNNGLDVVLIDIDDILSSNPHHTNPLMHRFDQFGCSDCIEEAKHLKHLLIFRLYMKLQASGWPLILLSRKSRRQQNATVGHLISAGYSGWTSLIMRSDDEVHMDGCEYFSKRRAVMQKSGFHIAGVISSHMDALTGPYLGKRIFKLPNAIYYSLERQIGKSVPE
ncbi:hypothetical protein FH972_001373 [Carpinus fangiana]|uniref:Acid phosphatase n=1 Tax=Carpinus fangiana TaxID=176857 RepID=A0A5N6QER3_9ROSI|nr:hypothetical protein FH972_001373 [Carpinus fangiana]KAE7996670.1 hypothetical protein FH972_001373 [Carpinus fangiana]KAE7996671.1 hypothetical protein FH972_001373 [Carpinus fangiana]